MSDIDLTGARWDKIDGYTLFQLQDHEKTPLTFSGTRGDYVAICLKEGRFTDRQAPFLLQIKSDVATWPETEIPGLTIYSRIGNILAARGDIYALIALAKDKNVLNIEASRPGFQE